MKRISINKVNQKPPLQSLRFLDSRFRQAATNRSQEERSYDMSTDPHSDNSSSYGNVIKNVFRSKPKSEIIKEIGFEIGDLIMENPREPAPYFLTRGDAILVVNRIINNRLIVVSVLDADGNISTRYSSNYQVDPIHFIKKEGIEKIREELQTKKIPLSQFLENLKITRNGSQIELNYIDGNSVESKMRISALSINTSSISCGIQTCNGVNNLFGETTFGLLTACIINDPENFTNEVRLSLCKKIIEFLIKEYLIGFLLFSTNDTRNQHFRDIAKVMDNLPHTTITNTYNRNSSNMIRLWIVDCYKIQNT